MQECGFLSLKEQAYASIRETVLCHELQDGKVYSERWFAEKYNMSRTPVREALLQFRTEGILETVPNRGFRLRQLTMEDASHVFETRAAIEGFCCSQVALRHEEPACAALLEEIERKLELSRRQCTEDLEMFIHLAVLDFINNPFFNTQYDQLRTMIRIFWQDAISTPNIWEQTYQEHRRVLEAMKTGNSHDAYMASLAHIDSTICRLRATHSFSADR